jgi:signal transduction histidine kinase/ligand-binding sensor domain-containing protein
MEPPWARRALQRWQQSALLRRRGAAAWRFPMSAAAPRLWLALCLPLLLAPLRAGERPAAPDEFACKAWETDDGLPHNSVATAVQTRDGFLWVATLSGLARFDGVAFTPLDDPLLRGTRSANIVGLIEENTGTLLISANQSGLVRLRAGELTPHPLNARFTEKERPAQLFREADDVFWVLTTTRGLLRWDHGAVETFPPPAAVRGTWPPSFARDTQGNVFIARGAGLERYRCGTLEALPSLGTPAVTVAAARAGGVWIAAAQQLAKLDASGLTTIAAPAPWNSGTAPPVMFEDREGALWLGTTDRGLLRWCAGRVTAVDTSHPQCVDLGTDDEGNLWVCTAGGGLNRVQRRGLALVAENPDWSDAGAATICEDAAGMLWFASRRGVQRLRADGRPAAPAAGEMGEESESLLRRALPIAPDARGQLWLAVNKEVYRITPGLPAPPQLMAKSPSVIHALFAARDGTVWIGSSTRALEGIRPEGTPLRYGAEAGFTGRGIRALAEDAQGHLWAGTTDGQLFEKRGERLCDRSRELGLEGHGIRALHADAEGRLWVATNGGGLVLVAEGRGHRLGLAQGLADDVLSQILEDDYGWLWFGSRRGLFKVRKHELADCAAGRLARVTPILFGRSDGLSGLSAVGSYQPTAWKSRNGDLWFVTRKGLVRATPDPHEIDPPPLRVYLERLGVDGRAVALPEQVPGVAARLPRPQLTSAARRLDFAFVAPTFTAPERVRYRYRLAGFDSDWVDGGTQRTATYPALRPGTYEFQVNASSVDGAWAPAVATLRFAVLPLWWETWWARIAAVVLGAAGLVALVRLWSHRRLRARLARLEQEQHVDRERARIARDLHDDLGASLTHVGMMAEELAEDWPALADPGAQTSRLAQRVRTIARDLDAVVWTVSPRHDNLAALAAYLSHFAEEYFRHSSIACRIALGEIPPMPLSPEVRHHLFLIAKELLANALKHSQARRVELALRIAGDAFELTVADDGRGFSVASATHSGRNGLKNLHERAAELGAALGLASTDAGTTATLRFPIG